MQQSECTQTPVSYEKPIAYFKETQKNFLSSFCTINEDESVIQLLNKILDEAIESNASDIHFEPFSDYFRIRFRQDGLLAETLNLNHEIANRMGIRLKILSNLDISEKRIPQDGRFKLKLTNQPAVDFRISTCPTLHGEKIVIRLLYKEPSHFHIDALGLGAFQYQMLIDAIQKPQGMILITGPTGSGKTISLYAILNYLNQVEKNILTIEDPIEIQLPGINQININPKIGLGFSKVLRALLRQDPDIIMVGEIRDSETAEVAIQAAQTGHLVFATLHTNSALETLERLINLGIKRFNITSAVSLLIAQRLVRRLCDRCKMPKDKIEEQPPIHELEVKPASLSKPINSYQARGCPECRQGYKGRTGVFEFMALSPSLKTQLLTQANYSEIEAQARREGVQFLYETGMDKVQKGLTTSDEIQRVIGLQ